MFCSQQVSYIDFQGKQVAVHCDEPELLLALSQRYCAMIVPAPTSLVAELHMYREAQIYRLHHNDGSLIEMASFTEAVDELSYAVSLCFIQAYSTLLWFHAGVASYQGQAVMLAGSWGQGKSTLVTSLIAQGWAYLSDELAPLDPISGKIFPFPRTPMVREPWNSDLPRDRVQKLRKRPFSLSSTSICKEALPIGTLVFPQYSFAGPNALGHCSPATAAVELLRNTLNFADHARDAVRYLCGLVQQIPAFYLHYHRAQQAAELIIQTQQNNRQEPSL